MDEDRQCILMIIGADEWGNKDVLGLVDGFRENTLCWRELLLDLKRRGLKVPPMLAVGDGAMGFWAALREVYGRTRLCCTNPVRNSSCKSSVVAERFIVGRPIPGLAGGGCRSVHALQLPRWIHKMNPSPNLCNRACRRLYLGIAAEQPASARLQGQSETSWGNFEMRDKVKPAGRPLDYFEKPFVIGGFQIRVLVIDRAYIVRCLHVRLPPD